MARVVQYIAEHLDGELSVEILSSVAGFSSFHFQRQFRAYVGVSPLRFVRLMRLRHASMQLVLHPEAKITDISMKAGFEAPESFWRAFRRAQGQSPSNFRKSPNWQRWSEVFCDGLTFANSSRLEETRLVEVAATKIALLEHHGPPDSLMQSVLQFVEWRKQSQVCPVATSRTFGIAYVDPETVAPKYFRFGIAASLEDALPDNSYGVVEQCIPAGPCLIQRHHGSTQGLADVVTSLYRDWLPTSGYRLRDFPCYFHYVARMPRVTEHQQITDVYLPISPKVEVGH